jgi:hypothetical protein
MTQAAGRYSKVARLPNYTVLLTCGTRLQANDAGAAVDESRAWANSQIHPWWVNRPLAPCRNQEFLQVSQNQRSSTAGGACNMMHTLIASIYNNILITFVQGCVIMIEHNPTWQLDEDRLYQLARPLEWGGSRHCMHDRPVGCVHGG